jgi:hypothetical protein
VATALVAQSATRPKRTSSLAHARSPLRPRTYGTSHASADATTIMSRWVRIAGATWHPPSVAASSCRPGRRRWDASAVSGTLAALTAVVGVLPGTAAVDLGVSNALAVLEARPVELPPVAELLEAVGAGLLVLGMWTTAGVLLGSLPGSTALAALATYLVAFIALTLLLFRHRDLA